MLGRTGRLEEGVAGAGGVAGRLRADERSGAGEASGSRSGAVVPQAANSNAPARPAPRASHWRRSAPLSAREEEGEGGRKEEGEEGMEALERKRVQRFGA